jgi:hypothetical protein
MRTAAANKRKSGKRNANKKTRFGNKLDQSDIKPNVPETRSLDASDAPRLNQTFPGAEMVHCLAGVRSNESSVQPRIIEDTVVIEATAVANDDDEELGEERERLRYETRRLHEERQLDLDQTTTTASTCDSNCRW